MRFNIDSDLTDNIYTLISKETDIAAVLAYQKIIVEIFIGDCLTEDNFQLLMDTTTRKIDEILNRMVKA